MVSEALTGALATASATFAWALAAILAHRSKEQRAIRALVGVLVAEGALQFGAGAPALLFAAGWTRSAAALDVGFLAALLVLPFAYVGLLRELPTPLVRIWHRPGASRGLLVGAGGAALLGVALGVAAPDLAFFGGALAMLIVLAYALASSIDARQRTARHSQMRQRADAFLFAFGIRDALLLGAVVLALVGNATTGAAGILAAAATLIYLPLLVGGIVSADLFVMGAANAQRAQIPRGYGDARPFGSAGTYAARELSTGVWVVVKDVPGANAIACLAGRLGAPRVASLLRVEDAGDRAWAVFRYEAGESLRQALARGPLDEKRAIAMARDVCTGLVALAQAEIVHADITPSNIILGPGGEATLVDLGNCHRAGETARGGTPRYMAPEQARSYAASPAWDVYSLALCVWEAVESAPYLGDSRDLGEARLRASFPGSYRPVASASDALNAWLEAALQEAPGLRFPTAARALEALPQRS